MKLSVIIVNYNVKYFLEQALLSVRRASRGLAVEVWVVDNNSVDDSVPMVQEKFPEVKVIANKHNPGFSIANNQAIRQSSGEYVLLLNPDTVVEEDTFEKCIGFMDAHPEAGGLGVRMIDGSGKFLPESKRGFPSPWVAFCKTVGLSRLFPASRLFNHYHLGYLEEHEVNEVEVLAGAFMMLRRSVLDEVGLLDEAFFMYGEDIDLSYRIIQAGSKNYYFPETSIIHYKGESTKKGSLNYVKAFYTAMIIFARKHFRGEKARLFVLMLQGAIYFRALVTVISGFLKKVYLPLLDAALIFGGLVFLKNFWAVYHFRDPNYYHDSFLYFNAPLYITIWLAVVYFSGGYDQQFSIRRLLRGLLVGTVLLAAVYGFLDLAYRTSRALIVLGALWASISTVALRFLLYFMKYGNFNLGRNKIKKLVIVGSREESERVQRLLHLAQVRKNFIGTVAPWAEADTRIYLSRLPQLDEVVQIYKIEEVIFCSQDVRAQDIMSWMARLGPAVDYKIVPQESLSIIGSSSKNTAGELYTIDIQYSIAQPQNRRNKRINDFLVALLFLLLFPALLFFIPHSLSFFRNILSVLAGRYSWVGYAPTSQEFNTLPVILPGILSPLDALPIENLDEPTVQRLNFLYAKDYHVNKDLDIIWRGWQRVGREKAR
ncbi:MAG: glycosyltransferase [Lewinellaceae bacterium]|nr:glycosyltransferase [Phaeodactylibacter sp.]MCB0614785.1 glycosyltransferase [Phaeodactylibacter sp.]MCB9351035.1 glycosyltransferase [Lewinellaceae bacterium]